MTEKEEQYVIPKPNEKTVSLISIYKGKTYVFLFFTDQFRLKKELDELHFNCVQPLL